MITNEVIFTNNLDVTKPYKFVNRNKNVIIAGNINSDSDIKIFAHNIIVLGNIKTSGTAIFNAEDSFFHHGTIEAANGTLANLTPLNISQVKQLRRLVLELTQQDLSSDVLPFVGVNDVFFNNINTKTDYFFLADAGIDNDFFNRCAASAFAG